MIDYLPTRSNTTQAPHVKWDSHRHHTSDGGSWHTVGRDRDAGRTQETGYSLLGNVTWTEELGVKDMGFEQHNCPLKGRETVGRETVGV